jgi:UDP-N-acetylglucosamine:LPS N-acetylglucosamine transferase
VSESTVEPRDAGTLDVLLVCSAGGHLLQLHLLRPAWSELRHAWVTLEREDALSLLEGETVHYAFWPTTRHIPNLLRNTRLAWRLLRELRPRVIVTTGAGVAVPFAWLGRLLGARVIYIESLTRIERPSMTCRMIQPVADRVYVQWPELAPAVRKSRYSGKVVDLR